MEKASKDKGAKTGRPGKERGREISRGRERRE